MANIAEQTLASIATEHHQTVPVLERYHLDFCCKGKRTLLEACTEKGLSVEEVIKDLKISTHANSFESTSFAEMNAGQLIRHILLHHHFYTRQSMPAIEERLNKVATKHGSRFPYMKEVLKYFSHLKNEMYLHMQKEEVILFPRIKQVEAFAKHGQNGFDKNYIDGPVTIMENEHDEAGTVMEQIRLLTNDYTAPEDACTTFKVVLSELKHFEEGLHQHVHLENNLLFPMAKKLILSAV